MKKLLTFPFRATWQAVVVPVRVLVASLGLTFRAGLAVGKLPVKGGAVVSRALGWKILGALTVGVVIGVVIGRQIGRMSHGHDHSEHAIDGEADAAIDAGVAA